MDSKRTAAIRILNEAIRINEEIARNCVDEILKTAETIARSFKKGGKLIICGNGGSAADAQHIAAEFVGRFQKERRAYPAIALSTNTSTLTALANDYAYDIVFSRQVEAFARENDTLIGISTSGNAGNVLNAINSASKSGLKTIAFTGGSGGLLAGKADISIIVPSRITARIQEAHIIIAHIICEIVENSLTSAA